MAFQPTHRIAKILSTPEMRAHYTRTRDAPWLRNFWNENRVHSRLGAQLALIELLTIAGVPMLDDRERGDGRRFAKCPKCRGTVAVTICGALHRKHKCGSRRAKRSAKYGIDQAAVSEVRIRDGAEEGLPVVQRSSRLRAEAEA